MMQVVLDSDALHNALIPLKLSKIKRRKDLSNLITTPLDKPLQQGRLVLVVDDGGGLIGEWSETCGPEYIEILLIQWEPFGAVNQIRPEGSIGFPASRQLKQLGFNGPIDRLILRIALATTDKIVTSEDSDFWDPRQPRQKGNPNAPVAQICRQSLGITVLLLGKLLQRL